MVGHGRGGYVVMWELGYLWGVCDLRVSLGVVEFFCVGVCVFLWGECLRTWR